MSAHEIVWQWHGDFPRGELVCNADEGADCRLTSDCDCELWTIERDRDGSPYHLVATFDEDVRHENRPADYCNVAEYLNDENCESGPHESFEIARTPVAVHWYLDGFRWERR